MIGPKKPNDAVLLRKLNRELEKEAKRSGKTRSQVEMEREDLIERKKFFEKSDVQRIVRSNPRIEQYFHKAEVRNAYEKDSADTVRRLTRLDRREQRNIKANTSTKVFERAGAQLNRAIENKIFGSFGMVGRAFQESRQAKTRQEAKEIRRDFFYREAANFLERNFWVPGQAYAQRLRNNITRIRSDDPAGSFEAIKGQFSNITDIFDSIDDRFSKIDSRIKKAYDRIDKREQNVYREFGADVSGLNVRVESLTAEVEKIKQGVSPNSTVDLSEVDVKVNTMKMEQLDIRSDIESMDARINFLEQQLNGAQENKNYVNDNFVVPAGARVNRFTKKPEEQTRYSATTVAAAGAAGVAGGVMSRWSKYMRFGGRFLGGLGAGALLTEGILSAQDRDPRRVGTRKEKWLDRAEMKYQEERMAIDNYDPAYADPIEEPWWKRNAPSRWFNSWGTGPAKPESERSKQLIEEIKAKGFKKASLGSGILGFLSGSSSRDQLKNIAQQKQLQRSNGGLQSVDDRIYRNKIEQDKSQFMQFGKLPGGFEFTPGHMGRLGQANAVAAAGAQPLSGDYQVTVGGRTYGGGSSGGSNGVSVGSVSISEDAKKVIADAVAGNIPLQAAAVDRALKMEGLHERGDRETLKQYLKTGGTGVDPAVTPWCASFVNSVLAGAGVYGSGSNVATSFLNWGDLKEASEVQKGDVLVEPRGRVAGETGGHVGLATGNVKKDSKGKVTHVEIFEGNYADRVNKRYVSVDKVQVRRANEQTLSPDAKQALGYSTPSGSSSSGSGEGLEGIDPNALKFIRSIGARETGFNQKEADSETYNQAGNNANVRKYGKQGADYGFFQTNRMDVEDAIRRGVDPSIADALDNGGGKGKYTVEQQTRAMNEYLQRLNPAGYKAMIEGDWDSANKAFKGKWPSLPGGKSYRPANDAKANAALRGEQLPGSVSQQTTSVPLVNPVQNNKISPDGRMNNSTPEELVRITADNNPQALRFLNPNTNDDPNTQYNNDLEQVPPKPKDALDYNNDFEPIQLAPPSPPTKEMETINEITPMNEMETANEQYTEEKKSQEPQTPYQNNNSTDAGKSFRNDPETRGAEPGSGARGAGGRCFV